MDTQLNSFLERFDGLDIQDPADTTTPKRGKTSTVSSLSQKGIEGMGLTGGDPDKMGKGLSTYVEGKELNNKTGIDLGNAAGKALGAAPDAIGLFNNFTGSGYDTSAEGGGVGNGTGQIVDGTMKGASLGMTVGGPWGAAAGAVVGGVGSALAHGSAKREHIENVTEKNLRDNDLETAERRNEYARDKGLASLKDLKNLRQKQLGIIS